jgi:hypothetical protein
MPPTTQTPASRPVPVSVSPPTDLDTNQRLIHSPDRPNIQLSALAPLDAEEQFAYLQDTVQRLLDAVPAAAVSPANPLNQPPPPAPQITIGLTATGSGVQFAFQQGASNFVDGYRVYRSSTNSFATATPIRFFTQISIFSSITVDDITPAGSVFYYWVTSVSPGGAESMPTAAQAVAVVSGSVVDTTGSVVIAGTSVVDSAGNILLKNVTTAVGSTSSPTTTSLSFSSDVPEMSISITTHGRPVLVSFNGTFSQSAGIGKIRLFRDAVAVGGAGSNDGFVVATNLITVALIQTDTPAAGSHTYHAMWEVTSGGTTLTAQAVSRFLQVAELG